MEPVAPASLVAYAAALACTLVGTVGELRTGKIPNALALASLAAGVGVCFLDRAIAWHASGLLLAFVPSFLFFLRGWSGGGAVKLFTGIGLLLGPWATLCLWLLTLSAAAVANARARIGKDAEANVFPTSPVLAVGIVLLLLASAQLPWLGVRVG